jgi:hypothetical protein
MAHDPYRNPNDPLDPRPDAYRDLEAARSGSGWGWIVGGVVAVLLVIFFLSYGSNGDRTASTTPPPATTGQNTGTAMTPPAQRPATPQENTGMAPRDTTPAPAPAENPKPQ